MYRTRVKDNRLSIIGSYTNVPGGTPVNSPTQWNGVYQSTYDESMGIGSFNNFDTYTQKKAGGIITGHRLNGTLTAQDRTYSSYPCTALASSMPDPDGSLGFPISVGQRLAWAWKVVAETNPERAEVLAPMYVKDFAEIPKLLRWRGLSLLNIVGRSVLIDRWVLRPLISDLVKMSNFTQRVHTRLLELNRLAEGKTIRKRVKLGQGAKTYQKANSGMESAAASISGHEYHTYTYKAWGSIQWFSPSWSPYRSMPPAALEQQAIRDVLGLSTHGALATLWEAIPWSWLVDWFTNVGTLINAAHNSFWLTYRGLCIMLHQKCDFVHSPYPLTGRYQGTSVTPITASFERKRRWVVSPILPLPMMGQPILSERQLSTLWNLLAANEKFTRKIL